MWSAPPTPAKKSFKWLQTRVKFTKSEVIFSKAKLFVYKLTIDSLTEDSIFPTEPCHLSLAFLHCCIIPFLALSSAMITFISTFYC